MAAGFINVLKPPGPTSREVVERLQEILGIDKAGHGGTLDPLACGVLPVALGRCTRLLEYVQGERKCYRVEVVFGIKTTSHDLEGEVVERSPVERLEEERLLRALPHFTGEIEQVPPMFSAIRHRGRRLYDLAREGKELPRQARKIIVYELKVIKIWPEGPYPRALLEVTCSKGTYVRTLCHDLGEFLGYGAASQFLLRTQAGPFKIETAWALEEIVRVAKEGRRDFLLPPEAGVQHLPAVVVKKEGAKRFLDGSFVPVGLWKEWPSGLCRGARVRLHKEEGGFLGIALYSERMGEGFLKPEKVIFTLD